MANQIQKIVLGSVLAQAQSKGVQLAAALMDVALVVMIDDSSSMEAKDCEGGVSRKRKAQEEIERLQKENAGKILVIEFAGQAEIRLDGLLKHDVGYGTNMTEALRVAQQFDGTGVNFVMVSDGEPDREADVIALARTFKTPIQTVFVGNRYLEHDGVAFLKRLADVTGGKYQVSLKPAELAAPLTAILALPAPK